MSRAHRKQGEWMVGRGSVAFKESLRVLRERDFRTYWLGQTASRLGSSLVPVATVFAVLRMTGSATEVGGVLAVGTVSEVLALMVAGVWADRLPRRAVMLASDCVRTISQTLLAVLLISGHAEIWHLFILTGIHGFGQGFFRPAAGAIIPELVGPSLLHPANSLVQVSGNAVSIVGPAVAGLLVAQAGTGTAFLVDAATFAVSAASLLLLRVRRLPPLPARSFLADLVGGWREITSRTWLWAQICWDASNLFFVVAPILVLGPVIADKSLGGASAWGAILACFPVGALIGGLVALRWQPRRPLFASGILLPLGWAAPAAALALRLPVVPVAAAELLSGVTVTIALTNWTTMLQQQVPADRLSRVNSNDILVSSALMPLGFAVAGPVSGAIGVSTTLWVSVAWVLGTAPLVLAVPAVRSLRFEHPAPKKAEALAEPGGAAGPAS